MDNLIKSIEKLWVLEVAEAEKTQQPRSNGGESGFTLDPDAGYLSKAIRVCELLYQLREGPLIGSLMLVLS